MSTKPGEVYPVDDRLEPALIALVRLGLPEQPIELAVSAVEWGGKPAPNVETIAVEEDGTLRLEAQPPYQAGLTPDPADWKPTCFQAEVAEHGPLVVEMGASTIIRGTLGSEVIAVLNGWKWKADTAGPTDLWAARLKFMSLHPPWVLRSSTGNLVLAVNDTLVRGWRFTTQHGNVFLLPNGDHWYLALQAGDGDGPDACLSRLVRSVVGFMFGEPFDIGVFRRVNGDGVRAGLLYLGLTHHSSPRTSQQPPTLPFACAPTFNARLVDGLIQLAQDEPGAPVLEAVHLYFAALEGFVESKFLHAWVGLEALARWGIKAGRIPDGGNVRLADHDAWVAWVATHRAEIERLAVPGMAQSLINRVQSAEYERPSRVQRAFRGLGIPWTAEMEDAERIRNGVTHEGVMPAREGAEPRAVRNWDRDLARVGLVKTMLTALFAKLVDYDGPIADKSKTCFDIAAKDQPEWWVVGDVGREVDYCGRGVDKVTTRALADLDRFEAEGYFSGDTEHD